MKDQFRNLGTQQTIVAPGGGDIGVPPVEHQAAFERVLARMLGSEREEEVHIGRYEFVRRLGAGGMGVVYLVRDPDLDRLVALKLLKPHLDRARGDEIERRMRSEARAMARLDHPNVVGVHEVGVHDGRTYLAMEYVAGTTLTRWLERDAVDDWRAVVEVFIAAGEGLAAAHAAGLAHCDFKPDNVLLGDNGVVKVSDFGLVRVHEPVDGEQLETIDTARSAGAPKTTRATGICGTPAFMAPEQFAGSRGDFQSDQFSFCVALYTALYDAPPFRGETVEELRNSVLSGLRRPPSSSRRVPASVYQIVARGLSFDPDDRWPTMGALLTRLQRTLGARARRRRWTAAAACTLALVTATGATIEQRHSLHLRARACQQEGARVHDIWNDAQRRAVQAGILSTGASFAETTAAKVTPWLDRYAEDWARERTRVCERATLEERLDEATLERARWCLDGRALQLSALVEELTRANEALAQRAITSASRLDPVDPCTDLAVLATLPDPPPHDVRDELASLRARLARADTIDEAGDHEGALQLLEHVLARGEALAWPPLTLEAKRLRAYNMGELGEFEAAAELSAEVYSEAARAGVWRVAATAANNAARVLGYRLTRYDEARVWSRSAEALSHLAHDPLELRRARLLEIRAITENRAGNLVEAKDLATRAVTIHEASLGAEHPSLAGLLITLANVQKALAEFDAAQATYERALAIVRESEGERHPQTAVLLNNIAVNHVNRGAYAEARALFSRVLEIRSELFGLEHPDVARVLVNIAAMHERLGEDEEAIGAAEEARRIFESTLGSEHSNVAKVLNNLAVMKRARGDREGALADTRRAIEIFERSLGAEHPSVATSLLNLAAMQLEHGSRDAARRSCERAVAIRERALGPEHPEVGRALDTLAVITEAEGDSAGQVAIGERAVSLIERSGGHPDWLAEARFHLAEGLIARGRPGDRPRARSLARAAAEGFRAAEDASSAARVDTWLSEHIATKRPR